MAIVFFSTIAPLLAGSSGVTTTVPQSREQTLEAPSIAPQFLGEVRPPSGEGPGGDDPLRPDGPRRIVTVAPSVTELVYALGEGRLVVGVSRYDDYPPEVERLPRVGGFLDPSVEAILALAPDLVIGVPNGGNRARLERVAALGVPVFVVPGNTFADVFHAIRAVGDVLGKNARTRAGLLVDDLLGELERLSKRAPSGRRPRVAVLYGKHPLVLGGRGSFADGLLRALGAENVAEDGPPYPHYSMEGLVMARPDVLIDATVTHAALSSGASSSGRSGVGAAALDEIPAEALSAREAARPSGLRGARLERVDLGGLLRPSPRLVPVMRALFVALYPDVAPLP